jgi:sporulation protein YlmC with PRC-barrel domain
MTSSKKMLGVKVRGKGRKGKRKIGKIHAVVVHPTQKRVVGYMVKRPDFLLMIKRKDKFLSVGPYKHLDAKNIQPPKPKGSDRWDDAACKRLGIDLDKCVLWDGMPIFTESGKELGYVRDIEFSEKTGKIKQINNTESGNATLLLGVNEIPIKMVQGYRNGAVIVSDEAADVELSGGLAAKAGAASAKAGAKTKKAAHKAKETTHEAVEESKETWGTMFKDTVEAYKEGRAEDEPSSHEKSSQKAGSTGKQGSGSGHKHADSQAGSADSRNDDDDADYDEDDGELARKFGRQLRRASGMFSDFKDEYKKEENGGK